MDLYTIRQKLSLGTPITQIKLRVTDYSRVSTDHEEQKSSLKNQVDHFDEMIKSNQNWTYVNGYVDEGISGMIDLKRENFMRMIEDAKIGKFDLIVTKEISRFSRNTLDSIKYTRELLNYGVAVYFVNDNINTALPDAELRLTIMASMAQDEIRRLSERVKFGMKQSIKNGHILGNNTLYGYKKDKITGNLIIVESEAKVVKRLFSMYAIEKLSLRNISKIFNEEKIRTCYNKEWCISTLTRMLKNPKYKGYYCGKKSEVVDYMTKKVKIFEDNEWITYEDKERIPPIVSKEIWQRANHRLQDRKKKFGKDYTDKIMYKNRYPLSAKIYCGHDFEVYHRRKQVKSSDDITWVCSKFIKGRRKACDTANIRESEIYRIFKIILNDLSIDETNSIKILDELYKINCSNIEIEEQLSKYNKEKDRINLKKDKILELNIEGILSKDEFCIRNNRYNEQLNKIEKKINLLENNQNIYSNMDKNRELKFILNQQINKNKVIDKLINLLLDRIVVNKLGENKTELNVFLKFSKKYVTKELSDSIVELNGLKRFMMKECEFKRGYETSCTKRYIVNYVVNCYLCH